MSDIPRRLKQLEERLASPHDDEAMYARQKYRRHPCLSRSCPANSYRWYGAVGNKDAASVFENTNQVEQLVGLIMERYNVVAAELQRGGGTMNRYSTPVRDTMRNYLGNQDRRFRYRPCRTPKAPPDEVHRCSSVAFLTPIGSGRRSKCTLVLLPKSIVRQYPRSIRGKFRFDAIKINVFTNPWCFTSTPPRASVRSVF